MNPWGIALLVNPQGIVQSVIVDDVGVPNLVAGQPLGQVVDAGSRVKLLNFMVELSARGAAFDWEINVPAQDRILPMRLAGASSGDELFVVGSCAPIDASTLCALCENLGMINNEQANVLRDSLKRQIQASQVQSRGDAAKYDEISRLNNELVALHRDLAKKNIELERLNTEIKKLAVTDPLTDLYNRRGFLEIGEKEIERARRFGRPLSVLMFDLDHFKNINDSYGHAVGDRVLQQVSARCRRQLRSVDIVCRYGGDEFTALLPESHVDEARRAAERILKVAGVPITVGPVTLNMSISMGVTHFTERTADLGELLGNADRALYTAKGLGRNRVCVDV